MGEGGTVMTDALVIFAAVAVAWLLWRAWKND